MNNNSSLYLSEQSNISLDTLRMKQSVRTTFKLSKETISLLGLMAGQLGIKQKSLLDQLTEDTRLLYKLAQKVNEASGDRSNRYPKTFVISRNALESINEVAKRQNIPRDVLVEISIKRLLPVIETELERHIERKKFLKEMREHLQLKKELRQRAKEELGENDEIYDMIDKQVRLAQKNISTLSTIIKKGMPMEDW